MTASLAPNLPPAAQDHAPMTFSGKGREFLNMLIKGSLFQIPTFGFYRFWLITKLRRHLWANTQVGGETFEYTGTAKELLIGFLIALAVLTPLYLAYFLASIMLEEQKALASLPLLLVIYVLARFGSYRARKYRATRTVFRGVRFWMKGSGWAYAFRAVLWDLATLLSLGLALPWAMASLERYRMRHTYFGSVQGDFVGTGWTLFKRGWWVWALGLAIMAGGIPLTAELAVANPESADMIEAVAPTTLVLAFLALMPLAMGIFTRWQTEGIRFGDVAVSSDLKIGAFYGLFLKLIFSSIGFVLAFAIIVGIAAAAFGSFFQEAVQVMSNNDIGNLGWGAVSAVVLMILAYLVLLLGMGVIQRYFMGRGLWALVVSSIMVSNLKSLDAAVAAGQPSGVVGEGLADALDFNVGV